MKRILVVILIVLFSTSHLGCTQKQVNNTPKSNPAVSVGSDSNINNTTGSSNEIIPVQKINLVKKINKTKYLLSNGIEIQREEKSLTTPKGEVSISIPKVFGLTNKALEERINNSIENDLENEVKAYVDERIEKPVALYPMVELNANNLLSISLRDLYSPPLYGFLYRLTDGKKLYLKDIFTEGTDYVPLINQKVVEGILMKDGEEENNLSKPFSTINPDQNFVLSETKLNIVFHTGESGFIERNSISIPLSEIDDYVDVTDRYSGTERKTQEMLNLIVRKNNIFITEKAEIIKKTNGNVWTYYPQISGLRDVSFEEVINGIIKDGVSEIVNNKALDNLIKGSNQMKDYIALIQMVVSFNHYGILCIERYVYTNDESIDLQEFNTSYAFDLIKKKIINPKDLLNEYIANKKELQESFANIAKNNLIYRYNVKDNNVINEIDTKIDYSFIIDKGQIYFSNGDIKDEIMICIHFKGNIIKDVSNTLDCVVPLKNLIKGSPEDFFGW